MNPTKNVLIHFSIIICVLFGAVLFSGSPLFAQDRPGNVNRAANTQQKQPGAPSNAGRVSSRQTPTQSDDLLKSIEDFDPWAWTWNVLKANPWIVLIVLVMIALIVFFVYKILWKEIPAPRHTTLGRTADDSEIKQWEFKRASGMYYLGENYPIGGYSKRKIDVGIPLSKRSQHIFVQAPTGSKKTTTMLIPQILDDAQSKIVNTITIDRKARDQFDSTWLGWKRAGHEIFYLSPWNPERSMGFEPLYGATLTQLRALVEGHIIISPDPKDTTSHYRVLEQQVLEAVFKCLQQVGACHGPAGSPYCRYKSFQDSKKLEEELPFAKRCLCRRHLCTLPAAADIISRGYYVIRALVRTFPEVYDHCTVLHEAKPSMQVTGMITGLAGKMRYYLDPGPRQTFSRSDFRLDQIVYPQRKTNPVSKILFIDSPAEQGRASAVFASVMSQLVYQQVNERREVMKKRGLSGDDIKHLSLRFDEIGTYTIPDINNMMATIRDTNTGCVLVLQDSAQFNQFYDRHVGETIQSNSYVRIYTGKIEQKRAEMISQSIGERIVSEQSFAFAEEGIFTRGEFGRKRNMKQTPVPIIPPDEVEVMCKDEEPGNLSLGRRKPNLDGLSIVMSEFRPFVVKKFPSFRAPKHAEMQKEIVLSQSLAAEFSKLNEERDASDERRPSGFYADVSRLRAKPLNWEIVPPVELQIRTAVSDSDEYLPLTNQQVRQIQGKARALGHEAGLNAFIEQKSYQVLKKPMADLTQREGETLKNHLDALIKSAKAKHHGKAVKEDNPETSDNNSALEEDSEEL